MPGPSDILRDGRFVVLGTLGEGAQGRTFDGVDKREGRPVAIKEFDIRGARAWKDVELAEREARVLSSLEHPKLPRYIEHFEENGRLYLVMEKIEGESLASMRKRNAQLSEADVIRFLSDASNVLDYLHGRSPPVFHRDLKPGNVILRPDRSFAFVDFGAVRERLRPAGGSTVVGTFGFMAPEQFQGRALPGSDVYAIAATALSLLTGSEPEDLPHRGLGIDVRAALRGCKNERLVSVLERMLDPDPDTRASRIAPLLAELTTSHRSRASERAPRRDFHDEDLRPNRHRTRREARAARRRERAERRDRDRLRGYSPGGPPWPIALIVTLVFSVGIVFVSLVTQVVVPLLLQLLAVLLGRESLERAATKTREAGARAIDNMKRSSVWLGSASRQVTDTASEASQQPQMRVEPDGARVRVEKDAVLEEDADLEEDAREKATGPRDKRSRR